jgi:tetratricopeptide (TPR) repeat protein
MNFLEKNAYHILGLDTSVDQAGVLRRSKEIVTRLKIGDIPQYDLDLGIFEDFRTEAVVKESVSSLSNPKRHIKEYFFWFQIADSIDEQAVGLLRKGEYDEAVRYWEHNSSGDTIKSFLYKKNLAILYCLLLFKEHNERYLKESVKVWHELCSSTKFWSAFTKLYKLHDELNTDQEILVEFQKQCSSYIADSYTELSQKYKDDSYIAEFTKIFNMRGEKTAKAVLDPIFHEITDVVEKLEAMKVSEDGRLDQDEATKIKEYVTKIQECSNKLIDLGLYDDGQSKTMRDRAAAAIRSIVLDIHNNLDDLPKAEQLLKIALQFVGTSGMKYKLQQDLDTFENNKKGIAKIEPIMNLIKEKKFPEALTLIDKSKEENKGDGDFVRLMDAKKKEVVTLYAVARFVEGKKLFDADKYDDAAPYLRKAASIVYDNIDIFDVKKNVIDSWLENIKGNVRILTAENAGEIDVVHGKMLKQIDDAFDDKWEQIAIKILINSYYFVGLGEVIKNKKAENLRSTIIRWVVAIAIFWLIGVFSE